MAKFDPHDEFLDELQELRALPPEKRLAMAVEMFFSGRPWSSLSVVRWKALTNTTRPTPQVLLNLAKAVLP